MILTAKHLKWKSFCQSICGDFWFPCCLVFVFSRRVNVLLVNSYTQMQTFRYEVDGIPSGKLACPAHQAGMPIHAVLLFFKDFRMFCVRLVSCCFHVMLKKSDFTGHVHAAGRFKEDNGNGPCSDCEAGRHQSELGQTACYLCSPGQLEKNVRFLWKKHVPQMTTNHNSSNMICMDDHQPQKLQDDMHSTNNLNRSKMICIDGHEPQQQ